jgi:Resolvase, N terminal domain
MLQPKAFKFRQAEERRNNYTGALPETDKKRVTAVLVRQSKSGADTAMAESRETQLGLQEYAVLLYGHEEPHVELYDEGAGVSGQKRIDQRAELDRLYRDMHKGIIGTIILAREDRIFRNKHMDQVGVFTKLAEEKRIKVVVPPISSAANEERTKVYDFTVYRDLVAFQDKMREAYGYIEGHVKHMLQCKQNKADKGGYDGRLLPPGLAVKGKKQNQTIVIYEPWAKEMRKLALRAQALDWNISKLNREVDQMAYLFPEIPEEDREKHLIKTCIHHIPGVGYKPLSDQTLRDLFTNEMLIGWWQPDEDKPDVIVDNHPAVLDYALFAEGYARLKGYTLEGEPVEHYRGTTRIRETRETPPELLFHGRLLLTPPSPDYMAYFSVYEQLSKLNYMGYIKPRNIITKSRWCCIPGAEFDALVIERLLALEQADIDMKDRVRTTLEQVYDQQSEDFVSIPQQIDGIKTQLVENAKKRMKTSVDDPMYDMLEVEKRDLMERQKSLEAKKEKLGMMDSSEEIEQLHSLLGNFEAVWPTFDLAQRQRAFSLLINRIEIEVVSPHWIRLSIDWLDAVCPRLDVAYIWKASPSRGEKFSDEEKAIIRQHYPRTPYMDILQMLPNRTWQSIQGQTALMGIKREIPAEPGVCVGVCYRDMVPGRGGEYLFRDYETTLEYIKKAGSNTAKSEAPLYAFWVFSETVAGMNDLLVQWHLGRDDCLSQES